MKVIIAVLSLACACNAGLLAAPALVGPTVIARAPSLDSAIIKSDRIGGNFAYSVAESHAHVAHTPIIQHVATPVAVSYSAPAVIAAPQVITKTVLAAPQVAVKTIAAPTVLSAPLVKTIAAPAVLSAPVVKTIAAPTVLSAPLVKTIAAPAVLAAPALKVVSGTPAATVKLV